MLRPILSRGPEATIGKRGGKGTPSLGLTCHHAARGYLPSCVELVIGSGNVMPIVTKHKHDVQGF